MGAWRSAIGMTVGSQAHAWYNPVDYGADPTGVAFSDTAFRIAADLGPIRVPFGVFKFSETLFTTETPWLYTPMIEGMGADWSILEFPPGAYLCDTAIPMNWLYMAGLTVRDIGGSGGYGGAYRNTYSGSNVGGQRVIERCYFDGYTKAAASIASDDSPNWNILTNRWAAANQTTSIGYAHAGWPDNSVIGGNSFEINRIHIKQCRGGPNLRIRDNYFARHGGASTGSPRVDIWVVSESGADIENHGNGMEITGNKFGNEGLESTDWRILLADEASGGTGVDDKFPDVTNASANYYVGAKVEGGSHMLAGGTVPPLVRSMSPNLRGWRIGPVEQVGSSSFAPLLSFKDATGFVHTRSFVGPIHGGDIDLTASRNFTVTDSGTLSGQPPLL